MEANDNKKYSNWTTTSSSMYAAPSVNGLADFLHQSVTSAWRLKASGKFNAAISQHGRCIITDTEKLLELMRLDQTSKQIDCFPYYNNVY